MEMEYGKAFTYPRQDPDWLTKWGLAGLISLVPVLGSILVAGYGVEVTRRVIRDEARPLPEWSDFGNFAIKGLIAVVVGLAYTLPLILLIACANLLPLGLSLAGAEANRDVASALTTLGSVVYLCCGCLAAVYGLLVALALPAALGRYAATDQIGAAFQFNEVFRLVRAKPGMFFLVMLVSLLAALVLTALGVIACGVGVAFGAAYATLVAAHLQGQAYRYVTQARE
jgi:hypothetical protein